MLKNNIGKGFKSIISTNFTINTLTVTTKDTAIKWNDLFYATFYNKKIQHNLNSSLHIEIKFK